jgi:uracil-DNA glycosylase
VGVPLERCFFTNFFMGLVPGRISTGPFPGARDPSFVAMCLAFLVEQLKAASPRLLIVMGMRTPRHLAALAPELRVWAPIHSFRDLDLSGTALVPRARVQGVKAPFTVVVITHASLARSNRRHRRYRGLFGTDAEMTLLRDALEVSGLASGPAQPVVRTPSSGKG